MRETLLHPINLQKFTNNQVRLTQADKKVIKDEILSYLSGGNEVQLLEHLTNQLKSAAKTNNFIQMANILFTFELIFSLPEFEATIQKYEIILWKKTYQQAKSSLMDRGKSLAMDPALGAATVGISIIACPALACANNFFKMRARKPLGIQKIIALYKNLFNLDDTKKENLMGKICKAYRENLSSSSSDSSIKLHDMLSYDWPTPQQKMSYLIEFINNWGNNGKTMYSAIESCLTEITLETHTALRP